MATKEECKCIDSIADVLSNSKALEDTAKLKVFVKDYAKDLKKDISRLEEFCVTPPRGSFFRSEVYYEGKEDLDLAITKEEPVFAESAGTKLFSFLIDNASKMVKCQIK